MAKSFKITEIKPDDRNANLHSEFGMSLLNKSIEQNGVIEAITISSDNVAISGNARTEKFYEKGMEDCILVETDGTKPVVIKRTDIKSKTKKFYNAALAANIVAKNNIVMDAVVTNAICEEIKVTDWKVRQSELNIPDRENSDSEDSEENESKGYLDYTPNKKEEGSESYQPTLFPLPIAVNKSTQQKWEQYKKSIKISRDSDAFANLLNSAL